MAAVTFDEIMNDFCKSERFWLMQLKNSASDAEISRCGHELRAIRAEIERLVRAKNAGGETVYDL